MAIVLNGGPERKLRPRGLLLDAIDTFDAGVLTQGSELANAQRWLDGVSWMPDPCTGPQIVALDPCAASNLNDDTDMCVAYVTQRPFDIIDAVKAATLNFTLAELDAELNKRGGWLKSFAFAKALVGPVITSTPGPTLTLSSQAHAPNNWAFADAAVSISYAIALLESELADTLFNVQGMIHLPPGMMHQAKTAGQFTEVDGHYETPNGTIVVSDAGYRNPPPPAAGGAASVATEEWIYASGPVQYQFYDGGILGDAAASFDRANNILYRIQQSAGILIFDPCPVTAVLAKYVTA